MDVYSSDKDIDLAIAYEAIPHKALSSRTLKNWSNNEFLWSFLRKGHICRDS
jgi:hypothetical protein